MDTPVREVLHRGLEAAATAGVGEHEGLAETLGERVAKGPEKDESAREGVDMDSARKIHSSGAEEIKTVENEKTWNAGEPIEQVTAANNSAMECEIETFPMFSGWMRRLIALVEMSLVLPIQLLITSIAVAYIPTCIQVQTLLAVLNFWNIQIAAGFMRLIRRALPTKHAHRMKALYDQTEAETTKFSKLVSFLFPDSPNTNHSNSKMSILDAAAARAECAMKIDNMLRSSRLGGTPLTGAEISTLKEAKAMLNSTHNCDQH